MIHEIWTFVPSTQLISGIPTNLEIA